MEFNELLSRIALAFGIGLLIGLERGWHTRSARPGSRTAGVRTFALSGLLGGIVGALAREPGGAIGMGGSVLIGISFAAFAAVMAWFCRDENKATGVFSVTTAVSAQLTFVLGVYALLGDVRIATAAAVATTGMLVVREPLHQWVAKITAEEFESGLLLLAMTFLALPILPDRAFGPFGGVNPREVWLIAIILAAVSFAGYIAVKLFGERYGTLLAAAVGGMVSSTAVTLANARRAAVHESSPQLLAAGAALATAVSLLRVVAIVAVLKPPLTARLVLPLLVAAIVATAFAYAVVYFRPKEHCAATAVAFRNPFGIWSVIGLALLLGLLIMAGKAIHEWFGGVGTIAAAAMMGLFDVDAMTVSMTRLTSLDLQQAANAILVGAASNTLCKAVIGAIIGRGRFMMWVILASVLSLFAGWLTWWIGAG